MSFRMRWPTQYNRITQEFGKRPEFYGKFGLPGHEGIDFQGPEGSELYAVADGVVSQVRLDGDSDKINKPYGNQVRIKHEGGYESIYAHLVQVLVVVGQRVKAGEAIGLSGNTGNSFGAHLHFTLKKEGASQAGQTRYPSDIIDPTPYLEPFSGGQAVQRTPPAAPTMQVQVYSPEVGHLNIRSAPYVGSQQVAQIPHGTTIGALEDADVARRKVGQQDQWLWVRTPDGKDGYVAAWYLQLPGAPSPAPDSVQGAKEVIVESPEVPLKIRSGPGIENAQLAQAPHGTVLKPLEPDEVVRSKVGQMGQWLMVQTPDGLTGYTAAWYVRLPQPEGAVSFGLGEEEERTVAFDDLKRIKGIGPKIEALLNLVGIVIFEQVATMRPEVLKMIVGEAGIGARYVDTWPEQARQFAA